MVWLQVAAGVVALAGIGVAWVFFLRRPAAAADLLRWPAVAGVHRFWQLGWGFDWLYDRVFVRPFVWFAAVNIRDAVDRVYDALAWSSQAAWRVLSGTQTGRVRWYAAGVTVGAIVVTTLVLFL